MLLKEKAAPNKKKIANQNWKVPKTGTSASSLDKILPVIMHLDMATPSRYMEMAITGNIFHF